MTIRHIGDPTKPRTKSTLVAISAVLDWRYDHLTNILRGEPQRNLPVTSPLERHFEDLLRAEVAPVKEAVAGITDIVRAIDEKIDLMSGTAHAAAGGAETSRPTSGQPAESA